MPFLSESAHLYLIARCLVFQSSFIFFTGMLLRFILIDLVKDYRVRPNVSIAEYEFNCIFADHIDLV